MEGQIDSSFTTEQRDLFASGIVAEIGVNAYAVWSAIKFYADYNTGHAWPGMRTIGEKLGVSKDTVNRAIEALKLAHMVRITDTHTRRRGQTYIARERMCVRLGSRVLCTIVFDYVPNSLRGTIQRIENALKTGENDPDAFAEVEVIPGQGFAWDEATKTLRGRVLARELPHVAEDDTHKRIGEAILSRMKLPKR